MHDTKIDESTIKPCPYCGGEGYLFHWEDCWYVTCARFNCNNPYFYLCETPERAIDAWNKLEVNNEG